MEKNSSSPLIKSDEFLFAQLPHEINYIIVNFLDAETLLKLSGTCKRWRANTQYLENLTLRLTNKSIRERASGSRWQKVPEMVLTKIDWKPLEATLKRFNPERLRSLHLYPDLAQNNELVSNFISRAVNVTKLDVTSSYQMDAILTLPKDRLKEINFSSAFDERCSRFLNLESIGFSAIHSEYAVQDILQLRGFKNLTRLQLYQAAAPYIDFEQLGQLPNLKELDLEYAYLEDGQFAHLAQLTNLEVLKLSHLQKEIPVDEMQLDVSEVRMIQIGNANPVSGLRHLTNLVKLTYLDISKVQKTYQWDQPQAPEGYDIAGLVINHFTKLKEINISSTALGKDNRQKLKEISWLKVVDEKDRFSNVDDGPDPQADDEALQAELNNLENGNILILE